MTATPVFLYENMRRELRWDEIDSNFKQLREVINETIGDVTSPVILGKITGIGRADQLTPYQGRDLMHRGLDPNTTFDLESDTVAATYYINGGTNGVNVPDGLIASIHRYLVDPITLGAGSSWHGMLWDYRVDDSGFNAGAYALVGSLHMNGEGLGKVIYGRLVAEPGFSGVGIGMLGVYEGHSTDISVAYALNLQFDGPTPVNVGAFMRFDAGLRPDPDAGEGAHFGIFIEPTALCRTSVIRWNHGDPVEGDFLQILGYGSENYLTIDGYGRLMPLWNEHYSQGAADTATTIYINGASVDVGANNHNRGVLLSVTGTLASSSSIVAHAANLAITSSVVSSSAYGGLFTLTMAGAGDPTGMSASVTASSGATGNPSAVQGTLNAVATIGTGYAFKSTINGAGALAHYSGEGDNTNTVPFWGLVNSTSKISVAALRWNHNTTASETAKLCEVLGSDAITYYSVGPAGHTIIRNRSGETAEFLKFLASGGGTLYSVDVTGRVSATLNTTYDLASSVIAANIALAGSGLSVATGKRWSGIFINPSSVTLSGTGALAGLDVSTAVTSSASGSAAYGALLSTTLSGAGAVFGASIAAGLGASATGDACGLQVTTTSVATANAAYGLLVSLAGAGASNLTAYASLAGDSSIVANFGVLINSTVKLGNAAFQWVQNNASETADYQKIVSSSSATLYQVTAIGEVNTPRLAPAALNVNYNLSGSTRATHMLLTGSGLAVATGKVWNGIRIEPSSVDLDGTASLNALDVSIGVATSDSGTLARGALMQTTVSGAGSAYGALISAGLGSGATGNAFGLQVTTTSVSTANEADVLLLSLAGTGAGGVTNYLSMAGDGTVVATFGELWNSTVKIGAALRRWMQNAATETAALDEIYANDGTTMRYQRDYTGKLTAWNSITLTGSGEAIQVNRIKLTAQSAVLGAPNTLGGTQYAVYTVPTGGSGRYRVTLCASITTQSGTAAGTQLGGSQGVQVYATDPNDNVYKMTRARNAGVGTSGVNTTDHAVSDSQLVWAKAGTDILISYGYSTAGSPAMQYDAAIVVEFLGD